MAVPLLNLKTQYESLKSEIDQAILSVVESQHFILGPDVASFEEEAANYLGAKYAIGVSSGTDALLMALMAMDIQPGDEVITTPYSFFATAGSIARLGAIPKFIEIDSSTFNLDPLKIKNAITSKTKAILPVHLFGQSANMDAINKIAKEYQLNVIEDAAQAIGAKYADKMVGNLADVACFSFFPSKNLGCFGDAGLVTTNDQDLYERLISIRNHGMIPKQRYYHQLVGGNFRIDTIQAAVLRVKLPRLNDWIEMRRSNAEIYRNLLTSKLPPSAFDNKLIVLPEEVSPSYHTYNQFVIQIPFRDAFLDAAKNNDVGLMVYYPLSLHLQPCFKSLGYVEGDFIISEKFSKTSVALPIYPEVPQANIEEVVDLLVTVGRANGAW